MEGQHQRAGVMGECGDHCIVLARGSSLTSSLFSEERQAVKTSVVSPPGSSQDGNSRLLLSPCRV